MQADRQLLGGLALLAAIAAVLCGVALAFGMAPRHALGSVALWLLGRLVFRR